jgi:hypothetical protein
MSFNYETEYELNGRPVTIEYHMEWDEDWRGETYSWPEIDNVFATLKMETRPGEESRWATVDVMPVIAASDLIMDAIQCHCQQHEAIMTEARKMEEAAERAGLL